MTARIRFGLLSFAHFHANFWADAINGSDKAELVGIWDDDVARGQAAASKYGTQFVPDLAALLDQCDAVGITSETAKHVALVEAAAARGVNILLEKPMARNLAECRRIVEIVRQSGVTFMQNFPKRYDPINHELIRLVRDGVLGEISLVRVRHGNAHLMELGAAAAANWFGQREQAGGGALLDEGIHAADLLLWLLGEPEKVSAFVSNATLGLSLEDTALAIFSYPSGALAEIATGGTLLAAEGSIEVFGTHGVAVLSGVDMASRFFARPPYLKIFRRNMGRNEWEGIDLTPNFQHGHFHHGGPLHFIEVLRGEAQPVLSLEDGWKPVAMIEAAYRASETGQAQPVTFSLDPDGK